MPLVINKKISKLSAQLALLSGSIS